MQIHRGALPKPAWQLASSNIFWILFASPTLSSLSLTPTIWEQLAEWMQVDLSGSSLLRM
jgi:hypothetical protein